MQRWLARLFYFEEGGDNVADPPPCLTGRDNYGDGIRTNVLAVIISNRRDLIVFSHCGGLLTGVSSARVRSGHIRGAGAQILSY